MKRHEVIGLDTPPRALVLCSGGMYSTVLANYMQHLGWHCNLLYFDYGQAAHRRQLANVMLMATKHTPLSLQNMRETMPAWEPTTWRNFKAYEDRIIQPEVYTPNRNAIFAQIALGYAIKIGASCIAFGFTSTSRSEYPDRDQTFVDTFNTLIRHTLRGYAHPMLSLYAPFIHKTEDTVIQTGLELEVSYSNTWSCYHNGAKHCGTCSGCIARRFALAGLDTTEYEVTLER